MTRGSAVRGYKDYKTAFMAIQTQCVNEGFNFIPMVLEAVGNAWGTWASKVFLEILKTKS